MAVQKLIVYNSVNGTYDVIWVEDSDTTPNKLTRKVGGYSNSSQAEQHRVNGS